MLEKVVRWFVFAVLIALAPVIFSYLSLLSKDMPASIEIICSHGELLILSVGINAAAIGELFGRGTARMRIAKVIAGGGCVLILLLATLWFADISAAILSNKTLNTNIVLKGSLVMFISTIISSGSSIALSEI